MTGHVGQARKPASGMNEARGKSKGKVKDFSQASGSSEDARGSDRKGVRRGQNKEGGWVPPGLRDKLGNLPQNNPWRQANGEPTGGEEREVGDEQRLSPPNPTTRQPVSGSTVGGNLLSGMPGNTTANPQRQQEARQALAQTSALFPTGNKPASGNPGTIIDQNVLNSMARGDTAGFIRTLGGNVQSSLNHSAGLFFQITA